jgi:hypothetical protein
VSWFSWQFCGQTGDCHVGSLQVPRAYETPVVFVVLVSLQRPLERPVIRMVSDLLILDTTRTRGSSPMQRYSTSGYLQAATLPQHMLTSAEGSHGTSRACTPPGKKHRLAALTVAPSIKGSNNSIDLGAIVKGVVTN